MHSTYSQSFLFYQNVWAFSKKALHYIVFDAQVVYINGSKKQLDSVVQEGPGRWSEVPLLPFYIYASSFECQNVQLAMSHPCANTAMPSKPCISQRGARACDHTINDRTARPVLISTLYSPKHHSKSHVISTPACSAVLYREKKKHL